MAQAVVHHLAKGLFAIGVLTVLFLGIRRIHRYNRLIDSIYADNDDKRLYGITTILILMVLTGILSFAVNAVGRFVFLSSEIPCPSPCPRNTSRKATPPQHASVVSSFLPFC